MWFAVVDCQADVSQMSAGSVTPIARENTVGEKAGAGSPQFLTLN
jgi:hypothetical protein